MARNHSPEFRRQFVPPPTVTGAYKIGRKHGEMGFKRLNFAHYFANAVEEPPWRTSQYRAYRRGHEAGIAKYRARMERRAAREAAEA